MQTRMNTSENLTTALRLLRSEHSCIASYIDNSRSANTWISGCKDIRAEGIQRENGLYHISDGFLRPMDYQFTSTKTYPELLRIHCADIDGLICTFTNVYKPSSDFVIVYEVPLGRKITTGMLCFYQELDTSSYRKMPEPDEEGEYIITPLGGYTKSCKIK